VLCQLERTRQTLLCPYTHPQMAGVSVTTPTTPLQGKFCLHYIRGVHASLAWTTRPQQITRARPTMNLTVHANMCTLARPQTHACMCILALPQTYANMPQSPAYAPTPCIVVSTASPCWTWRLFYAQTEISTSSSTVCILFHFASSSTVCIGQIICLCYSGGDWYTWCEPPATFPSQINLLVVNASAVAVNFVTNDQGTRDGCRVEAQVKGPPSSPSTAYSGYSTTYKDSESDRILSYHHVTLHSLAERTAYSQVTKRLF
jgi:hypothetical protein